MKNALFICFVLLCFLASPVLAQEGVADSVAKYMTLGKSLADQWDHQGATIAYLKVLKFDSTNYEAAWRAGDHYTELADALPEEQKSQKEAYFEQARKYCQKAIAINPDGWEGHLRLSVVYGRLGLFRGGKEKVKLAQMVRMEAEKTLELNPQSDIAHHVLARWHQNVANLSSILKFFAKTFFGEELKGTNEEAVEHFEKAIVIDPNHIEHYLELARTYKFMGQKELMREPLEKVLELPAVEQDDPEFKKEAEEMLKKLK